MTVGELKRLIADVDDDTPVLLHGTDHSYRIGSANITRVATPMKRGGTQRDFYEWYGSYDDYEEPMRVVDAVVVE